MSRAPHTMLEYFCGGYILQNYSRIIINHAKKSGAKRAPLGSHFEKWCPFERGAELWTSKQPPKGSYFSSLFSQ